MEILTVGHSNRTLAAFLELLAAAGVRTIVDVRTLPRSRRLPHFSREQLAPALERAGIRYEHAPALGGLREPRPDSTNLGLPSGAFRGYADHMETETFQRGLDALMARAGEPGVAILCAEAQPQSCHRSMLADALVARGVQVRHLLAADRAEPHALTRPARIEGGRVRYPGEPALDLDASSQPSERRRR